MEIKTLEELKARTVIIHRYGLHGVKRLCKIESIEYTNSTKSQEIHSIKLIDVFDNKKTIDTRCKINIVSKVNMFDTQFFVPTQSDIDELLKHYDKAITAAQNLKIEAQKKLMSLPELSEILIR